MEDFSESSLTIRSLLKGILATEPVRTAVKHQSKKRVYQQPSTSSAHQDENSASPSMNLRGKMKERVRRSLGKSAFEVSVLKRKVETNPKSKPQSAKKGPYPIIEDLDEMTPRTLLRKIIQNEDEVSMIVSQRPKPTADHADKKPADTPTVKLSSVNLSLPAVEEAVPATVFRKATRKRKMRVSEFEREVDERLRKNKDNYNISNDDFEASALLVNSYTISRSIDSQLDISAVPEVTFKKGLLRRPNKINLVSLDDFEKGVEEKYHQLKGSQECFISEEDKSDSSSSEMAEKNTELYAQSLRKDINISKLNSKQRGASKFLISNFEVKETTYEFLETKTVKLGANTHPTLNVQSPEENTKKDIQDHGEVSDDSDEVEAGDGVEGETGNDGGEDDASVETDASDDDVEGETSNDGGEDEAGDDEADSDEGEHETSDNGVKTVDDGDEDKAGDGKDEADDDNIESADIDEASGDEGEAGGDDEDEAGDAVETVGDDDGEAADSDEDEASDSGEDDAGDNTVRGDDGGEDDAGDDTVRGDDGGEDDAGDEDAAGDDFMDVESNMQQHKSTPTSSNRRSTGIHEYSHNMQHRRLSNKNGTPRGESINLHTISVSRPEESSESSESSDDEILDLAQSATGHGMAKKKEKKQLMLSALPETPAYIKPARFVNKDKPAISKKIQTTNSTKPKKPKSVFTNSHLKQLFSHHAKLRVSKESLADVEKCLDLYLNQLAVDLSTYTAHANRKTITRADLELLMRRQRLVTDTTSLNVLIEKHLPLDCRTLLIPCAMSGNKVFPKM